MTSDPKNSQSPNHEIGVHHGTHSQNNVSILIKSLKCQDFVRSCGGLPFMQILLAFSMWANSSLTASVSFAVRSSQLEVTYAAYACSPISGTHASKENSVTWHLKQLSWLNLISIKSVYVSTIYWKIEYSWISCKGTKSLNEYYWINTNVHFIKRSASGSVHHTH